MKAKYINNHSYFTKLLSLFLSMLLFIINPVCAEETSESTDLEIVTLLCQIEPWSIPGFIEPISLSNDSYVVNSNYKYDYTQLWCITNQFNGYYTIKSNMGELYLHTVSTTDNSYVAVDDNSKLYSFGDNYLWKIEKIDSALFSDTYTISSKVDETKYLTIHNGYVSLTTGIGSNREIPTRFWKLHNTNYQNLKEDYTNSNNTNHKIISLINIYDDYAGYKFDRYSGEYINGEKTDVLESCWNIGASNIKEYHGFNKKGLIEIISESSVCVITTHGTSVSIECGYHEVDNNYQPTYINKHMLTISDIDNMNLPDNYLSNAKCVLLTVCEAAAGGTESFAYKLHQKGVQAVVGFTKSVGFDVVDSTNKIAADKSSELFNQYFLESLGNGKSVRSATEEALAKVYNVHYPPISSETEETGVLGSGEGIVNDIFGLDSYCFFGDENIKVIN